MPHSVECLFQHFMSYSNQKVENQDMLRAAFYAGANVPLPSGPISPACPVCDKAAAGTALPG